jgi:tousled-like kinase
MNNFLNKNNNLTNNNSSIKIKNDRSDLKLPNQKLQPPSEKNYIQTSFKNSSAVNSANINNSNVNNSTMGTPEGKSMKSILEENEKLKKEITDKEKAIKSLSSSNEDYVRNISLMTKQFENQNQMSKYSLIKILREHEELKRNNKKKWLNEQEFRLGRFNLQRVGQTVIDIWENGDEFIKLNNKLREIEVEKEKLEKQKKNLASFIKKRNPNSTLEGEVNNENELNDMRELINFKLSLYQKEESEIRENIGKLEIEKIGILLEKKRLKEEESSRFRGGQSKEKFPILAGRYLILSLLGKGGYSEVYKAYDLENNMEVACKIHQLNPQWSDNIKDNYIRHTIRENQIHKEILHSKIVRHYDTIEIDLSSFCTVLELCTGPDLHTYLKTHKQLPEKEARGIIFQILSGLEYLNKLQRKIIHYDLKPQNIILHNMEVKISDFGLSKIVENNCENIELTSQGVGTYWYLPPECFDTSRNPPGISSKVDIWSLGVVLYELIYGVRPFGHNYTQDKILQEGVILNASTLEFPSKPSISKPCQVLFII